MTTGLLNLAISIYKKVFILPNNAKGQIQASSQAKAKFTYDMY